MALPTPIPFSDIVLSESTTSIATTPLAVSFVAPVSGILRRVIAAAGGTTTGTIAVAVAVNNGADVTGGGLTIAAGSNARTGNALELKQVGAAPVRVTEGDIITFTPSGGTGASIPGAFAAIIRPHG